VKLKFTAVGGFLGLAFAMGSANAAAPTDPQIAAIVVTANQVDIDAGKLALTKAQSPDVKKFAQLMITDRSPIFLIKRTAFSSARRPVDYERLYYRGDHIALSRA
jgi:predicted outer membrane protein